MPRCIVSAAVPKSPAGSIPIIVLKRITLVVSLVVLTASLTGSPLSAQLTTPPQVSSRTGITLQSELLPSGDFRLVWNAVAGAEGYRVYHSPDPALPWHEWSLAAALPGSQTEHLITNPAALGFYYVTYTSSSNPQPLVLVDGGTFHPFSSYTVTLSSFYIGRFEVTQAEYQAVMGVNPSYHAGNPNRPVELVSWYDAIVYFNLRSVQEGLTPCYSYVLNETDYGTNPANWPSGWNNYDDNHHQVQCDWNANGYRFPTEMEWLFAAKGGNQSLGYAYSGSIDPNEVAWTWENSDIGDGQGWRTHDVGTKAPNELGLYDMSGNVWEMMWDKWDIWYDIPSGSETNPTGPIGGSYRRTRGGNYSDYAIYSALDFRTGTPATGVGYSLGFRVARAAY